MTKKQSFFLILFIIIFLVFGFGIRTSEKGYHLHYKKQYIEADPYLIEQTLAGDGFSGYLAGLNRINLHVIAKDRSDHHQIKNDFNSALYWFEQGAKKGNLDAAFGYLINFGMQDGLTQVECHKLTQLVESGSATQNPTALINTFLFYRSNTCNIPYAKVKAAYFLKLSSKLDKRIKVNIYKSYKTLTEVEKQFYQNIKNNPKSQVNKKAFFQKFKKSIKTITRHQIY